MPRPALLAVLALAAAVPVARADANLLDPFPTVGSVGDTVYTTLHQLAVNKTGVVANKTADVKEAASTASHAVTNAVHDAKNPLGNVTYAAFKAVDAALYAKNLSATCNPADRKPPPKAFGFDGSGQLLPFYTGVVTGLQARGVLTPEVARSAKFGGLSGGSIVSVLAAAGWSGADMFAVYLQAGAAIKKCVIDVVTASGGTVTQAQAALQCTLVDVGVPILRTALEARNPDLISVINGRVDIWACQVNALGTTLANSVAQGTNKWTSIADIIANIAASASIPCSTVGRFYSIFRNSPMIDGGYCSDFKQVCPPTLEKDECLKVSTTFLGPNLRGTTPATPANCVSVTATNNVPYIGKPYYTPADQSLWTLPQGQCAVASQKAAVGAATTPFVAQGVSAKPDIHPFFYAPLPTAIASACDWLALSSNPAPTPAEVQAQYQHGIDSALGWADAHGYCA